MIVAVNTRIRQIVVLLILIVFFHWIFILILYPSSNMSVENVISSKMFKLAAGPAPLEYRIDQHFSQLRQLYQQFALIKHQHLSGFNKTNSKIGGIKIRDLSLPSSFDTAPNLGKDPTSLLPSFKWSKGKIKVSMVIGISTVKGQIRSYLETTLHSIFDNISDDEAKDVLVILMIAEPDDFEYLNNTAHSIKQSFSKQLDQGILEIIAPSTNFYPDFDKLKLTFGDVM